jgi:hypothetical protein
MKSLMIAAALAVAPAAAWAQVDASESLFKASFEGMFEAPSPVVLPQGVMEPNPPVPLDGGLILLLAGGAALARKRFKG